MKFGEKLLQTKLLSRLSHKVCCLLSSPVLLRNKVSYHTGLHCIMKGIFRTKWTICNREVSYHTSKECIRQGIFMHLSMLSPRVRGGGGGLPTEKLTERAFPWVGILTFKRCPRVPRVGNLTWPPSWKTERNWKWVTCHLGNTQKSPEVNYRCFSWK